MAVKALVVKAGLFLIKSENTFSVDGKTTEEFCCSSRFITVKYHFIFLLKEPAAGTGKTSFWTIMDKMLTF